MLQVAVFVDAGYLFAQGSTALAGQKQPRNSILLKVDSVLDAINTFAVECVPDARLLRIYWYDGVVQGRLSSVQEQLAGSSFCKLRLGLVNSAGEQKGVDSLIVTDMIELARNHAISDAILLSGDEDLRIGVQIAQGFGVRVHLVGIKPARGSQSPELIKESDTHHEWHKENISCFLSVETAVEINSDGEVLPGAAAGKIAGGASEVGLDSKFADAVDRSLKSLTESTRQQVVEAYKANPESVPMELDRKMLPTAKAALGRWLEESEKRRLRTICADMLQRLAEGEVQFSTMTLGRPDIVDMMKDGGIDLVMNTTEGAQAVEDSRGIRAVALSDRVPYFTTAAGSHAAARAIRAQAEGEVGVKALQG